MKKNILRVLYFLCLTMLLIGLGYVFIFDLIDTIKNESSIFNIQVDWIARRFFFEFMAFISMLCIILISIIFLIIEKQKLTKEEIINQKVQKRKQKRKQKILQLNAKIEKLKNEDDE